MSEVKKVKKVTGGHSLATSGFMRARFAQIFLRMARHVTVWPTEVGQVVSRQTEGDPPSGDHICNLRAISAT
jgi:hypothetical protein